MILQALTIFATLGSTDPELALVNLPASEQVFLDTRDAEMGSVEMGRSLALPKQFDHPFAGVIKITWVHPWTIAAVCHGDHYVKACTEINTHGGVACNMYLPAIDPVTGIVTAAQLRAIIIHERGHCNGWPADHSDGVS